MAGLSIRRRRRAWIRGVVYGATGKGKSLLRVPKLVEIFQKGCLLGQMHADNPRVRSIVEQEQRRWNKGPINRPRGQAGSGGRPIPRRGRPRPS